VFLAISGALAVVPDQPPVTWLRRRLVRVYPAFWLALLASFVATWAFGYKSFGAAQVASQLLGTGWFTHPANLVNSASWFISLLLACYATVFVARVTHTENVVCLVVGCLAVWKGRFTGDYALLPVHMTSFFVAYLVTRAGWLRRAWVAGGLLGAASVTNPYLAYPAVGVTLISLSAWSLRSRFVACVSGYSYEFYLVHGMFFVGIASLLPGLPVAGMIATAIAASCAGAWILNRTVGWLRAYVSGAVSTAGKMGLQGDEVQSFPPSTAGAPPHRAVS